MRARQRLIDWANAQEGWVRKLVGGAAPDQAYAAMLVEKGLAPGEAAEVPALTAVESPGDSAEALVLVRLRDVGGVNLLAPGQHIVFHPRLTVLYGENAAGKSGYVRILKRLAGVRAAEPVLPNFRAAGESSPRATIDYTLGGRPASLEWHDEAGVEPFTRLSVLDTRAVSLHVDDDLTYVVTPADLAAYRQLHETLGALKAKLDAAAAEARPAAVNPFLGAFQRDAEVWPKIEALGAATDVEALKALAGNHAERLAALREQADALRPETGRGRLQAAIADAELYGAIASLAASLRAFDGAAHAAAVARVKKAEAAREAAVDAAFSDDDIPGANLASWRAFIAAAERFLEDVGEKTYPSRGDECLYCREPLKPAAMKLVKRYRAHIKDSSQRELDAAVADLAARKRALETLPIAQVATLVKRRVDALEQVPALLTRTFTLFELAMKLQAAGATDSPELVKTAREVEAGAEAERQKADELVASAKKQAGARQQELDAVLAELRTLENKLALQAQLPGIAAYVEKAKWAAAAAAASGRISAVMRSLTEQSKAANEEVLNQDFERLFLAECEALKAPKVEVGFSGRKGQAARRKVLSDEHRLSELLSEGEQKAIALADFLAEAMLRPASAPIVLDDPVTSLDHERTKHVVERVGLLSEARQVVVFTHSVTFARALVGRVPGAALLRVSAAEGVTGRVAPARAEELLAG